MVSYLDKIKFVVEKYPSVVQYFDGGLRSIIIPVADIKNNNSLLEEVLSLLKEKPVLNDKGDYCNWAMEYTEIEKLNEEWVYADMPCYILRTIKSFY